MVTFSGKVVDRATTKPIYLVIAEDQTTETGIQYYKVRDLNDNGSSALGVKGILLTKQQADKFIKNPHAEISAKMEFKEIDRKIPWHKVIRIDNITYKVKPQGE